MGAFGRRRMALLGIVAAPVLAACGTSASPEGAVVDGEPRVEATGVLVREGERWVLCPPTLFHDGNSGGCFTSVPLEVPEEVDVGEWFVGVEVTIEGSLIDDTIHVSGVDGARPDEDQLPPARDCGDTPVQPGFAPGEDTAMAEWYRGGGCES